MNRTHRISVYWTVIGALSAHTAWAQQPSKGDPLGQLEEITVTATKRASTVQSTAISLTAVSQEEIAERGIADFTALSQTVPGLSMRTSGAGQTEFEMRGMTSGGGNSATVGFYLDDTPLSAPANAQNGKVVINPNLYDLNRVEVLRGPQGTLYGSGSMGGTIKLVPNAPDSHAFDASAETAFSGTKGGGFNHGENAMVNLPLGDTAALRIVGSYMHDSGWINRIVIADGAFPLEQAGNTVRGNVVAAPAAKDYTKVNDENLTSVRVSMLWNPTDRVSITPAFFYQRAAQDGLTAIDSNPGTNAHYQPFDNSEPFADRFHLGSLNVQYRFDPFDLTSATSYWNRDQKLSQDATEQFQWAFSTPIAPFPFYAAQGGIGANSPATLEEDKSKQISEELRATSSGDGAFKWLAGYFYSDFQSDFDLNVTFPGAAPVFGTANLFNQTQPTKIIQNAFFGEVSYQLTPQWKATLGLRRFAYTSSINTNVSGVVSGSGSDTVLHSTSGERDQGINPKVDLSYEPDKHLLLYATVSKGFRPGGGNQPIPTSGSLGDVCEANLKANHGTTNFVPAPTNFKPDDVWSYELGEKATLFEGRLTVNGAAYYEQWRGVQQNIPLACGYPYTDNSGDAHIYGSELEIDALLVPGLILAANAGYAHATFVLGSLEAGITKGTRVQDVPDFTSSISLAYRRSISADLVMTTRIENNYVGDRTDATYAVNNLASYDLTNVRLGVEGDRWKAVLFAKNAFNRRIILSNATQININVPTFNRQTVEQPLTFGIDLNYRFGH